MTYRPGHIKHNAETSESAMRTIFPEDQSAQLAAMAWLISHPSAGPRHAQTTEVENWVDLYTPPEP